MAFRVNFAWKDVAVTVTSLTFHNWVITHFEFESILEESYEQRLLFVLWPQYGRFTESPHLVLISFLRFWHFSIMSGS